MEKSVDRQNISCVKAQIGGSEAENIGFDQGKGRDMIPDLFSSPWFLIKDYEFVLFKFF